jgi:hypothetical protein
MEFRRDVGVLETGIIGESILDAHGIVLRHRKKRGRSNALLEAEVRREFGGAFLCNQISGIKQHREIRATAGFIGSVDCGIGAWFEMIAQHRREMPTGRKPQHSDALRINAEFLRATSHETEGALCILERSGVFRPAGSSRHAVF